jgi:RNA-binding protein
MAALTGADRRHLRALGNPLKPVVQIGEAGLSDGLLHAAEAALRDHELIKVRMASTDRAERRETAAKIAVATGSELVGMIGRVALFYRTAEEPERRRIRLPSADRPGRGAPGGAAGADAGRRTRPPHGR